MLSDPQNNNENQRDDWKLNIAPVKRQFFKVVGGTEQRPEYGLCQSIAMDRILETQEEARDNLQAMLVDLMIAANHNNYDNENCDFFIGPNKRLDVAQNKANRDYDGDPTRVTDYVRAKVVVTSPEQVETIQEILSESYERSSVSSDAGYTKRSEIAQEHDVHVARAINFFENPKDSTGYRCINYKLAVPVGDKKSGMNQEYQVVELQVVAKQLEDVYDVTHPHKRAAEEILDKQEDLTHEDRQRVAYNFGACRYYNGLAARDAGYDKLLLPEVRSSHNLTKNRELRLKDMVDRLKYMDGPQQE